MGKGIVSWFARNGVVANLLMIIIIVKWRSHDSVPKEGNLS